MTLSRLIYIVFIIGSVIAVTSGAIHGTEAILLLALAGIALISVIYKTCAFNGACQIDPSKQLIEKETTNDEL
jgi:hypothetical protein